MSYVAVNAAWNLIGTALPMIAGLLSVPMLLSGLGDARLGIFSLALGLIGFAGIFDLGLSRALTQTVAQETGAGKSHTAVAELVRRTLLVVLCLGVGWGLLLWFFADQIASSFFKLQGALGREAVIGIRWLAFTFPVALLASCLIGVLEGLQRFRQLNLVRAPLGVATFIVPAFVALESSDLGATIGSLAQVRLFGMVAWSWCLLNEFDLFAKNQGQSLDSAKMWRFTGWLSITNIVGPLMVYADRFYLATIFPPALVAHYTVPLDTLVRATTLPGAAMNAVFPAMAHQGVRSPQAAYLVRVAGFWMIALWFLPLYIVGLLLMSLLSFWVGAEFAAQIFEITHWLVLGILVNGFAHIPYALLQGAGRADITAKIHLFELPIYALAIVYLVGQFGVVGAAMAWFLRASFDTAALYALALLLIRELAPSLWLVCGFATGSVLISWFVLNSFSLAAKLGLPFMLLTMAIFSMRYFGLQPGRRQTGA